MLDKTIRLIVAKLPLSKLGTILGLGITALNPFPSFASEDIVSPSASNPVQTSPSKGTIPNGVHLYGRSSEPNQIGQEYLVFKVDGNRVIGAAYLPRSEFSCFSGTVNSQQMALSMVDPYNQSIYPYNIALQETSPLATASNQVPHAVGLAGYQRVDQISSNDRRLLNVCLENYQ